jgi:GxxExxY protein
MNFLPILYQTNLLKIMSINELSYKVRGAIFTVYKTLGPGLLESTYESALAYELRLIGLKVARQVELPLVYRDVQLESGYRIDILVEDEIIIEIKSIEAITNVHHKQVLTYLKLSGRKLGILVNFNSDDVAKSMFRKINTP